jgi:hypothetical protein
MLVTTSKCAVNDNNTKMKRKLKIIPSANHDEIPVVNSKNVENDNDNYVDKETKEIKRNDVITTDYCDASLFHSARISRNITVPFYRIARSKNIKEILNREVSMMMDGKCSIEGYVCPDSIRIIQHSCGRLNGGNIIFDIDISCLICLPQEQTKILCVAKTITQAGIRAIAKGLQPGSISPIEVFLSRDMNMNNNVHNSADKFTTVKEGDTLFVEIIGRRFVLNDTHVTIIALLIHNDSSIRGITGNNDKNIDNDIGLLIKPSHNPEKESGDNANKQSAIHKTTKKVRQMIPAITITSPETHMKTQETNITGNEHSEVEVPNQQVIKPKRAYNRKIK